MSALKTFGSFCARLCAAAVALPTVFAGLAIAIAGAFATPALTILGVLAGIGAAMIVDSDPVEAFGAVSKIVACSGVLLGAAIGAAGIAAGRYAAHGKI